MPTTAQIAESLGANLLSNRIPKGTIRPARDVEVEAASALWKSVRSLAELETHLRNHPEESVLLICTDPPSGILQAIKRSGAGNLCRVLTTTHLPNQLQ